MDSFLVTCEHGGNRIPAPCRRLFRGQRALLDSHRGYDPGALVMAKALAAALRGAARELDRQPSGHRPQSLDRPSAALVGGDARRAARAANERSSNGTTGPIARKSSASVAAIGGARPARRSTSRRTASRRCWTARCDAPTWDCCTTPRRRGEAALCARWKASLAAHRAAAPRTPQLSLCRQRRRTDFGTCAAPFRARAYVGIELEVNQEIVFAGGPALDGAARRADRSSVVRAGRARRQSDDSTGDP